MLFWDGVVPFEIVKLWDWEDDVRKIVMLWKRVEAEVDWVDGGQGRFPSPETSMATWRVSGQC